MHEVADGIAITRAGIAVRLAPIGQGGPKGALAVENLVEQRDRGGEAGGWGHWRIASPERPGQSSGSGHACLHKPVVTLS